jgi:hypothetical protein
MKAGDDESVVACRPAEHGHLLIVEDDEQIGRESGRDPALAPTVRCCLARCLVGAVETDACGNSPGAAIDR